MEIRNFIKGLLLVGLLVLNGSLIGQEIKSIEKSISATEDIIALSNSTILIRLNSQKKRLDYRKKTGNEKKIRKLEKAIEKEHAEIIAGAIDQLKFASFYFFYSHDSDEVIKKKNYSLLFDSEKNKIAEKDYPESCYLLSLEKPSWFSQVDTYFLILYGLEEGRIRKIEKPMPYAFRTKSGKLFRLYDFNKAFRKMNERLRSFKNERT